MDRKNAPAKATTAPKGRPTPSRGAAAGPRRRHSATWQWVALGLGLAALVVAVMMLTQGDQPLPVHQR